MWAGSLKTLLNPIPVKDAKNDPYDRLERLGQLVEIADENGIPGLPPSVTHVRLPNGEVKRIRFT